MSISRQNLTVVIVTLKSEKVIHSFIKSIDEDMPVIIVENSIVKINEIIIRGNDKTKENVIRRDIDIFPGEIFNQSNYSLLIKSSSTLQITSTISFPIPSIFMLSFNSFYRFFSFRITSSTNFTS